MGMPEGMLFEKKSKLEQSVDELFDKLRNDQDGMESGFNDSRGDIHLLLNILIKCPIYSFSRLQKVTESSNFKQLLSLANYYFCNKIFRANLYRTLLKN